MANKDKFLKSSVVPVNKISSSDINEMHQLLIRYYDNAGFDTFKKDLLEKDVIFLIRRKDNNKIAGFSTVVKKKLEGLKKGRNTYVVFSGDTIVDNEFWGTSALHFTAITYIVMEKLKNPTSSIFWFLITKGYKTYLAMANNLSNYYPHYKNDDPELKRVLRALCMKFFPDYYDEKSGLLRFGEGCMKLKEDVAEISEEMMEKYPKIKFFVEKNPTWYDGTELPCTVELSFGNITKAIIRQSKKFIEKAMGRRKKSTSKQRTPFPERVMAPQSSELHPIPNVVTPRVSFQRLKDV